MLRFLQRLSAMVAVCRLSKAGRRAALGTLALALACLLLALGTQSAHAQPPTCDGLINQLNQGLSANICRTIGLGNACLAARSVTATARTGTLRFTVPGNQAPLNNIQRMITVPQRGSAVLLGGSAANPVKLLIFGDTATSPGNNQPANVFTLRAANDGLTCERTRSGMILQTPNGQNGTIVVNGVTINLASTAYVVPGADLLFDQDPRIDRRSGSRNPDAPLCSGFDSDCGFGDDSCSNNERMVWGPFCREDTYSYIGNGLYRVTLYGEGEVQAGATDYGISRSYDSMGAQRLSLPGSYTFCWDGLEHGGTGFETVVQARSSDAYVEHITLEYLGRDCGLPNADDLSAGMGRNEMGMLTVYNVQGDVGVELPDGQSNGMDSGQRMRIYYEDGEPVDMDAFATDAPYIVGSAGSELAQWAIDPRSLGSIVVGPGGGGTGGVQPGRPFVAVEAGVLDDDGYPYALYIEAQANDPTVGRSNGAGIEYVHFAIADSSGEVFYEHEERTPPYCGVGDDSCTTDITPEDLPSGDYRVTATAYTLAGGVGSDSTTFTLDWESGGFSDSDDTTPPFLSSISSDAFEDGYCYGGELNFNVDVDDDFDVADVSFWWQAYNDGETPGGFEAYPLGSGSGNFEVNVSDLDTDYLEVYFTATDTSGNQGATDVLFLAGRDCSID